jgi:hypothetical protein
MRNKDEFRRGNCLPAREKFATTRVGGRNQNLFAFSASLEPQHTARQSRNSRFRIQDSEFKNTERKRFPARIFACREEIRH